ncbi:alpha/beta hydrolase [Nitratireductor sp. XY-223]|uniref:alpha/beta fold hydrolase n=1 Tax=Nitratireductor sp. XY-223 TaxID=2561926 RepID=UPI00197E1D8C|nr:alpha/beta hydrolase [Nitratireductor sp. XY-223]
MARETLILLPGMMCDARLFAPQINAFEAAIDVVVPELDEPSIEGMARAVLAGAPSGRFNVAGLSMGGIVAMAMAKLAPDRIARLALLDTNHHADLPERYDIRNRQIEDVRAGKLRSVIIDEMKPVYLAEANRGDRELLDLLVDMAMDVGADTFVAQSLALRDRPDHGEALRAFAGPALVLCGEEDNLCLPDRHREMAGLLPDPELVFVPDAGHISTLENSAAVNAAIGRWLSRSPAHAA